MSFRLVRGDPPGADEARVFVEHPELASKVWLAGSVDGSGGWRVESRQRAGGIHVFDWPHFVRTLPEEERGAAVADRALQAVGLSSVSTWAEILAAAEDVLRDADKGTS
jgi:hypothetical protein